MASSDHTGNQAAEKTREEWLEMYPDIYFGESGNEDGNQTIMTDGTTDWDMSGYKLTRPAKWVSTPSRRQREGDNRSTVAVGNPTTPLLRR